MSDNLYTEHHFTVACDNCGQKSRHVYDGHEDAAGAREHAAERGWDLGLVDLCPACVHAYAPHWRQHVDAYKAAYAEAIRMGNTKYRATICRRCNMWTISPVLDDE